MPQQDDGSGSMDSAGRLHGSSTRLQHSAASVTVIKPTSSGAVPQ